jgi:hypothetical protein
VPLPGHQSIRTEIIGLARVPAPRRAWGRRTSRGCWQGDSSAFASSCNARHRRSTPAPGDFSPVKGVSFAAGRSTHLTCVGTTGSRSTPRSPATEHPHVRGDDPVRSESLPVSHGTPPPTPPSGRVTAAAGALARITQACPSAVALTVCSASAVTVASRRSRGTRSGCGRWPAPWFWRRRSVPGR